MVADAVKNVNELPGLQGISLCIVSGNYIQYVHRVVAISLITSSRNMLQ